MIAPSFLAIVHSHSDSVPALRIIFGFLLVVVFFSGLYVFRIRKRLRT